MITVQTFAPLGNNMIKIQIYNNSCAFIYISHMRITKLVVYILNKIDFDKY